MEINYCGLPYINYILKERRKKIMELLKVSSNSNPNSIAGAIAGQIKEYKKSEIRIVGAAALNQAIKGIIIARSYLVPTGINIVCIPAFTEVEFQSNTTTGIKLTVKVED